MVAKRGLGGLLMGGLSKIGSKINKAIKKGAGLLLKSGRLFGLGKHKHKHHHHHSHGHDSNDGD